MSVRVIRALRCDLPDLTCNVTNNRLTSEQSLFRLQATVADLRHLVNQLQVRLEQAERAAQEVRCQVAVARIENQRLTLRLQAVEQALDLGSLD